VSAEAADLAMVIEGVIALTVLIAVLYRQWQRLCIDYARDVIFEQREAIFDLAARGRLQFGSDLYEELRDEMNGMLRLAHKLTMWRLIFLILLMRRAGFRSGGATIDIAIYKIADPQTRNEVTKRLQRARAAIVSMMLARSLPFLLVLLLAIGIWKFATLIGSDHIEALRRLRNKAEQWFARPIEKAVRQEVWMAPV
jgi:hypothetical protein